MKRWSEGEGPRQPLAELPSGAGERNNGDVLAHSGVRGTPARRGPSAAPEAHTAPLTPPQCGRIVLSERVGAGHAGRTPGVAGPVVSNALKIKRLRKWDVRTWLLGLLRQKHTRREFLRSLDLQNLQGTHHQPQVSRPQPRPAA